MVYVAGVDIGSAYSKAVIVADNRQLSYHIIPSGGNYEMAASSVLDAALAKANLLISDTACTIATGYGADSVATANEVAPEISCQARGVSYLFPSVRTIIDIGGQFSRVLRVNERGRAVKYELSEKCAGGSGRFLQVIARILHVDLEEIGPLSLNSRKRLGFSTGCAVFAESEAISRIAEGAAKEDLLAAVHHAMATKVQNLVERTGLEPDCALIGGGAKDIGLIRSIEENLGIRLLVPEEPQIVAAFGAALLAGEKV